MSEITLRKAAARDIARLLEIQTLAPEASAWRESDYQRLIETPGAGVLAAEVGEVMVGFLAYRATAPDEVEILNLGVASQSRRGGVASKLVRRLLESGEGSVFLEVRSGNAGAIAFYQKMGFLESGRRRDYYQDPVEDAILMAFSR